MNYNKITLSFPAELERTFRIKYYQDGIFQFRISFLIVSVIYAAAGFLDKRIDPALAGIFHLIRYGIVLPSLLSVLIFSFSSFFQKVWQELIFLCLLISGFCCVILTLLAANNYAYYAGMLLIFASGYFFVKLRFLFATLAGILILGFFNFVALTFVNIGPEMLLLNNFFFVSINIIGIFAAYNLEIYIRKDFYLNQKLDRQSSSVYEANRDLESKVEIRTKELMAAKELSEQSDRLKSAFLANISHEIRTPMNGILGFASLLKNPALTGAEQQDYLDVIERSGERMLGIINDIVDISKIESGVIEVNMSMVNINDLLEYIDRFFRPEAERKEIRLICHRPLATADSWMPTDEQKLQAILTNLVKNAMKFTVKGTIEIGYQRLESPNPGSRFEFYVRDTGIGIQKERQEAIFERFIQADINDNMAWQGAGLGLSISKSYLEMLGGNIWVESEWGNGSTFHFTLPFDQSQADKLAVKIEEVLHLKEVLLPPLNILIAEDDEISERILRIKVKKLAGKLISAKDGLEALEMLRNNPDLDLILMDMQMPSLNGYEAVRQIRKFNTSVVIIAQTAYALSGDVEKAIDAGCNDYLTKPIEKDQLMKLLQKYFGKLDPQLADFKSQIK